MNPIGSEPPLPFFTALPVELALESAVGFLYGKAIQANPILTLTIFAIRCLADHLFYHLANTILEGKDLHSHQIFLGTTTLVNMTFLIVLRELNLIGRLSSCLLGLVFIGLLINRVNYIQTQEKPKVDEDAILDPD